MSSVCSRLMNWGIQFEVNYLGSLRELWSFWSELDKRDFIANRFLWDNVLVHCEELSGWMVSAVKAQWFRLSGFLVKLWCPSFLNIVGNSLKTTLDVADRESLSERMDYCSILVEIVKEFECLNFVLVDYAKDTFSVKVCEHNVAPPKEWIWDKLDFLLKPVNQFESLQPSTESTLADTFVFRNVVVFEKEVKDRDNAKAHNITAIEIDEGCGLVKLNSSYDYFLVGKSGQIGGLHYSSVGKVGGDLFRRQKKTASLAKGKSVYVKSKKASSSYTGLKQTSVVIGKQPRSLLDRLVKTTHP